MSGGRRAFWRDDDDEVERLLSFETFAEYKAAGGRYVWRSDWSRVRHTALKELVTPRLTFPCTLASGFRALNAGDVAFDRRVCEAIPAP